MIPGPDSAAQIPIQAAAFVRRFGALVPYDVCPPLLPLLIAALGLVGVPGPVGYVAIVWAAYAGGCAAVYVLVRRLRPGTVAGFAALLYALAPSRLPSVWLGSGVWAHSGGAAELGGALRQGGPLLSGAESGAVLLCWSLVPVLLIAIDRLRRAPRPGNVAAAVGAAAVVWAAHPASAGRQDLWTLSELAVVLGVCLTQAATARRVALLGFLAALGWVFLVRPANHAPLPAELLTGSALQVTGAGPADTKLSATHGADPAGRELGSRGVFGAVSLRTQTNPVLAQARVLIASPGRLDESLLWLRAMAAGYLVSDDAGKFSGALECLAEKNGWRLYELPDPNPAPAVLVSRRGWEKLPAIRGLYDIEGLQQYLSWAGRPEPAGFRRGGTAAFEVWAELGPLDLFLVRRNCEPGWHAYATTESETTVSSEQAVSATGSREIPIACDPLGFMVLDAGAAANAPAETRMTRVRLVFQPSWTRRLFPDGMPPHALPEGEFPRITPGGVIEAVGFTPPPFRPGASLSIFGHNFVPGSTRVLFGETPVEVLWTGPRQINVRLPENTPPGELKVVVESAGRRSFADQIEVGE